MSKMDDLRAIREAKYEAARAGAGKPTTGRPRVAALPQASPPPSKAKSPPEVPKDELCGHRAISGKSCTREQGHAEKSHRYS